MLLVKNPPNAKKKQKTNGVPFHISSCRMGLSRYAFDLIILKIVREKPQTGQRVYANLFTSGASQAAKR